MQQCLARARYYLGAKAIPDTANSLDSQALQGFNSLDDDGVNGGGCMRVIAVTPLSDPRRDIPTSWSLHWRLVAIENIRNECGVALSGKTVGHQLAIGINAKDV